MQILKTVSKSGKTISILFDNEGLIIKPVFDYMKSLAIQGRSKNTIHNICLHLKTYFEWLEDNNLDYISVLQLDNHNYQLAFDNLVNYRFYLAYPNFKDQIIPIDGYESARTDRTINQMMSSVLGFYRYLSSMNVIDFPMFSQCNGTLQHSSSMLKELYRSKTYSKRSLLQSKVKETPIRFITDEDFNMVFENTKSLRDKVILCLLYYASLRESEVCGLLLSDVRDIYRNIIYVSHDTDSKTISRDAAVKYDSTGTVVVNDRTRDIILDYISTELIHFDTNYLVVNMRHSKRINPRSGLYEDSFGKPVLADTINDLVGRLGKKCGFKRLTPHMLRHSMAMNMLNHNIDIADISEHLRHSSIDVTKRVYAKYDLKKKIAIQEKLNDLTVHSFNPLEISNLYDYYQEDVYDD